MSDGGGDALAQKQQQQQQQLIQLLTACVSPDERTRKDAERMVQSSGAVFGFGDLLCRTAFGLDDVVDGHHHLNIPMDIRQLAALLLKKYVRERWQVGEHFFIEGEPMTSVEEKMAIRGKICAGLRMKDSKMRTACALVIAQIATHDWPEEWEGLLGELLVPIREKRDVDHVNGALRCMSMLCGDLEERQLPKLVPELFPDLFGLLQASDDGLNGIGKDQMTMVKCRALDVTRGCYSNLGMIGDDQIRFQIKEAAKPFLESNFVAYGNIFEFRSDVFETAGGCTLTLSALKAMQATVQYFGKEITGGQVVSEQTFGGCVERFFHVFEKAANRYVQCRGVEVDALDDCEDDMGDKVSNAAVVTQCMELAMTMIESTKIAKSCIQPRLKSLVSIAVATSLTTDDQLETWEDDVNQFVADEEDDYQSVRATSGIFLATACAKFSKIFYVVFAEVVAELFSQSFEEQNNNDENWWRRREAALLAVGSVSDELVEQDKEARGKNMSPAFDCNAFLNEIIRSEFTATPTSSNPFLKGRALWTASRLAAAASAEGANAILDASVNALNDQSAQFPVKIGACRSLIAFVPMAIKSTQKSKKDEKEVGEQHQISAEDQVKVQKLLSRLGDVYQGLGHLLTDATEEALVLILEALLIVVNCDGDAALQWLSLLAPAIMRIWAENVRDPFLGATARDVIQALANQPKCNAELTQLLVPELARVFRTPEEQPEMLVEASLDILACLLKACVDENVARGAFVATFENVATLAKTSDDVGIVQNALDAMKAFLRAAKGEAILSWGGSDPSSVSRAYLDACATSLQPHCEEGAALFVAPLLGQMIRRLPSIIGPMIPEMCDAVCARLQTATRPMLIASLLCIFARLAHVDANALVTLLASREIQPSPENENSKTQLEFVLKKWCEGQPDVHGRFDVKLTSTALGLILATQHPTLIDGSIVLKGRPIEVELPPGTIRTRSRAKQTGPEQFTQVSAPSKIISLLADSLAEAKELEADEWEEDDGGGGLNGEEFDDDDENDDEDDDDEPTGWSGDIFEKIMLKGLLDGDFFDDEEADDKDDPIDDIELVPFLEEGFKRLQSTTGGLLDAVANDLTESQRVTLTKVFSSSLR